MDLKAFDLDTNKKSHLMFKISGVVARPLKNGTWQPVSTHNDSCTIELNGYDEQDLARQMKEIFQKITNEYSSK